MVSGRLASGGILVVTLAAAQSVGTGSAVCARCHPAIAEGYRKTAMARSFGRPRPANTIEDYTHKHTYYHAPSDTHFEMAERDGKYFQRQYQIGADGKQTNILETRIDSVLGSGNHARTYLHETGDMRLIELPLGWYAENGGYWAMNPGYDRPDHQGLERAIGYDCMFCHNAYPETPTGGGPRSDAVFLRIPEGIDCQRCHGDGREHVRLATTAGSRAGDVRATIFNPARRGPDQQMEVCLQCHLETTSFSTANSIIRYEREPFSYQAGEPLADYRLHFDQTSGAEDRFEIVGAAYRLMRSQCFVKSKGAMTCTTCHDPHRPAADQESAQRYLTICRQCHASKIDSLIRDGRHPASGACTECHMPKRRTQDAVHVVITDHYIQRRKADGDLLAPIAERAGADYTGTIEPYYPATLARAADELYLAVAEANVPGSRTEGIAHLSAAIAKFKPDGAEYYLQLGDALRASGRYREAIAPYEAAVRLEPRSAQAQERLALGLTRVQLYPRADRVFQQALRLAPGDARMWTHLGVAYLEQRRNSEAAAAFEKALAIDATVPEAHNGLAASQMEVGNLTGAEAEFRVAIQFRPNYAEAHHNLANLLTVGTRFGEARYHFEAALRIRANHAETRTDYAEMLVRAQLVDEAQRQIETLFQFDPRHARGHDVFGHVLAAKGETAKAIEQYRQAVQLAPDYARANLDLGVALLDSGQALAAEPYLRKAAASGVARDADQARKLLERIR
jgi:predicted CXXCH cytochrome family protein